jgi:hypothetical protein
LAISDTVAHTVNPFATHQNALGMKRTIVSNHARKRETPVLKDGNPVLIRGGKGILYVILVKKHTTDPAISPEITMS